MDVYCQRCGEPYDVFSLTDDMNEQERQDFKKGVCCPCCKGKEIEKKPARAEIASILAPLLGDDIDGLAAMMEDAEYELGGSFWDTYWGESEGEPEILEFDEFSCVLVRCNACGQIHSFYPHKVIMFGSCRCGNDNWGSSVDWLRSRFGDFSFVSLKTEQLCMNL